jgi:hypothetical protein
VAVVCRDDDACRERLRNEIKRCRAPEEKVIAGLAAAALEPEPEYDI